MGARVLAFVAAIAMVLGAVAIRGAFDDDKSGNGDEPAQLTLVCATELAAVCEALDDSAVRVTVEAAAVTAARLTATKPEDAGIDGWLAPGPWGAIVDAARGTSAEALFADPGAALARSPFVLAVWKTRRAALGCPDAADLACVGDAVRTRGFRLGAAADDHAEGLLADAALAAAHAKNPNFATNDLTETDLADWLTVVDASVDRVGRNPGGRSITELLTFGTAAADAYLAPEAVVAPQLANAARRNELDVVTGIPRSFAEVVVSPRVGDRGERLAKLVRSDRVRDALRANGWQAPPSGENDGLPSAGVLLALRNLTK